MNSEEENALGENMEEQTFRRLLSFCLSFIISELTKFLKMLFINYLFLQMKKQSV